VAYVRRVTAPLAATVRFALLALVLDTFDTFYTGHDQPPEVEAEATTVPSH